MATYLVTGGAGFIGSNLVEELLKRDQQVRVIDNLATGRADNLKPFLKDIDFLEGDIRDYHSVLKAVRGVDYVLHQAALPSVPRSVNDPISSNNVNITGTLNLLHAAKDHGVQRFVYASSSSVYGDSEVSPKVESLPTNPKSPYAVGKLAAEQYCRVFHKIYGLETVMLRYFNVFGPRQNPESQYAAVIPKFLRMVLNGESPTVHGDGEQTRDFTFVQNNVEANLKACLAPDVAGEAFNIACGENYSLNTLVQLLNEVTGNNVQPVYTDSRPGDIKHSLAGIEKAQEKLGYQVSVPFREGLRRLAENFEQ